MKTPVIYRETEVCEILGIRKEFLVRCQSARWITPISSEDTRFDSEDLARLRLIRDLMEDFGVNEEGVPIILHLLDQLHYIQERVRHLDMTDSGGAGHA